MAAWIDLKSPFPLISTLIVRLIPNLCVNKGESMTFCASKPKTQYGVQNKIKMGTATMNVEACRENHDEEAMSLCGGWDDRRILGFVVFLCEAQAMENERFLSA